MTPLQYRSLTPDQRKGLLMARLSHAETQHYELGIRLQNPMPGADPVQDRNLYDQLTNHITELHAELDELEAQVQRADRPTN